MRHLLFILILSFTFIASAQDLDTFTGLHVVFDLDGTLLETVPAGEGVSRFETDMTIHYNGETFRLADFSPEVVAKLVQAGYKISFFTGGDKERSEMVVEKLRSLISQRFGLNFRPYKVLSKESLTPLFGVPETARTRERFKKDLQLIANPGDVVLIDDIKNYVMPGQEKSLLNVTAAAASVRESQKLVVVMEVLLQAREYMNRMTIPFLKAVQGLAQGTAPGPTYNDEVFLDFMRRGLNRFGLPWNINDKSYPILQGKYAPTCNSVWL